MRNHFKWMFGTETNSYQVQLSTFLLEKFLVWHYHVVHQAIMWHGAGEAHHGSLAGHYQATGDAPGNVGSTHALLNAAFYQAAAEGEMGKGSPGSRDKAVLLLTAASFSFRDSQLERSRFHTTTQNPSLALPLLFHVCKFK